MKKYKYNTSTFKAVEPATSTKCTLIRKTMLKSSGVSSNENFKLGGNLVCKARLSEFTIILIVRPSVNLFS